MSLDALKEDLKIVMSLIRGKSDKGTFALKRLMTQLEHDAEAVDALEKELVKEVEHSKYLMTKIESLEKKIEVLKAQLKERIRR